jgi:hypothetical protein
MLRPTIAFLTTVCFLGLSGCLLTHSTHTVIREDEPLQAITYESEQTRNRFEGYVQNRLNDDRNHSHSAFAVPFLIGLERSRKTSENGIRNDALVRFDLNGDGYISDYEISFD